MISEGGKIPDFTLPLATKSGKRSFTLSSELGEGPLVFAFYPLAFTGTCTRQICDVRDAFDAFKNLKAKVFGFSIDSAAANVEFAKMHALPFGIVSDPNREVLPGLGNVAAEVSGVKNVAKRSIFVLDKHGVLKWRWESDDPDVWPGVADIIKAVESAR